MSSLIPVLEDLNLKLKCEHPCCNTLKFGTLQQIYKCHQLGQRRVYFDLVFFIEEMSIYLTECTQWKNTYLQGELG